LLNELAENTFPPQPFLSHPLAAVLMPLRKPRGRD
jgi:hypothetical protein